ncbi:cysteine-rich CWC family protein [Pseudohalioglobus sediminis]|uniref:Cysteine-rich CWC family protein n=1 Tax=Pseudohalioglobus sediminis TaxID=2606449 RepID=A0A5B0WN20_9GAMM|nr:cysteine-rich CWC family protein [Pseudohalioglobus sediminis]
MDHVKADKCPLCGGDNACAIAAGRAAETCWCQGVVISAAALESLPPEERGVRCICETCATQGSQDSER